MARPLRSSKYGRVQKCRRVRARGARRVPGTTHPSFLFTTFLRSTRIIHKKFGMSGSWIFFISANFRNPNNPPSCTTALAPPAFGQVKTPQKGISKCLLKACPRVCSRQIYLKCLLPCVGCHVCHVFAAMFAMPRVFANVVLTPRGL